MKIVSKIIKIKCEKPSLDFIENYFKKEGLKPVRWAIVDVKENILTIDCAILV
jgi:hypothetical protein